MLSDHNEAPRHYSGPPTSESSLADALGPTQPANNPAKENQFSHCPSRLCLYLRDGNPCNTPITCSTTPEHFRIVHGIEGMARGVVIAWENCRRSCPQRNNFMRHIREVHMDHQRKRNDRH
ncbi:hypothetical protein PISMIDRAFT_501044 [Pisolithus microcarpus 441]|uniref:Unplaced genomic scaffold scaffold_55, whole genome shotgun sequence n=1 Tax=Pisolithus microcarpus 441 TaxID=765257 RepID=A0A0C9Z0B2_9AGAM|nr:hypothetical protein BKA83DRAFT_501044 [Pisolithus microcarpus]KIK22446.1 hypothetical protein PISMIDRAFT_501044 [Pisolithus microcarpus 441]